MIRIMILDDDEMYLKKEKDFVRSMGKAVELRTYRPIEKQKEFSGILTAYDDNSVTIEEDGALRTFDKKEIALIRLKIEFKQCRKTGGKKKNEQRVNGSTGYPGNRKKHQ